MIQNVYATSTVFLDAASVVTGLNHLGERLPGVHAAGSPLEIAGVSSLLRVGNVQAARQVLSCDLSVSSAAEPHLPQMKGWLSFQATPRGTSTKVLFKGACSRAFGGHAAHTSADELRHRANEHARSIVNVVVNALETAPANH